MGCVCRVRGLAICFIGQGDWRCQHWHRRFSGRIRVNYLHFGECHWVKTPAGEVKVVRCQAALCQRNEKAQKTAPFIALAKGRLTADHFNFACRGLDPMAFAKMQVIYADATAEPAMPMLAAPITLPDETNRQTPHTAY